MNAPAEKISEEVTLRLGEARITVPGEAAAKAYLEKLLEEARPVHLAPRPQIRTPIGAPWQDGTYAGLTIFENEPFDLILLPAEAEEVTWKAAMDWANDVGGVLPSRFDQLVLFKNLKDQFQSRWYWSAEQHAELGDYAWGQDFGDGHQGYWTTGNEGCARAVRRLPI